MKFFRINRVFSNVREFLIDLPELAGNPGHVIQKKRNVISKVQLGNNTFVIKDFKGMYFLNRLAYSLFRRSKAIRSYENSERLNALGIRTPLPVAWLDFYSWGLLRKSYFVSAFYPYPTLDEFLRNHTQSPDKYRLLNDLAAFTLKLHRIGIFHNDYSIGNIFVIAKPDCYEFALTDLNRMNFGRVNFQRGILNFRKLQLEKNDLDTLIECYAELNNRSSPEALALFYQVRECRTRLRGLRKKMRRYTVGLLEKAMACTLVVPRLAEYFAT